MTTELVLLLCSLLLSLCNGQTCISPVYNNSGILIKGPCPSSRVVTPIGRTIMFECTYIYTGNYFIFWNITDIGPIVGETMLQDGTIVGASGSGGNGYTTLTLPVTKQDSLGVQCGLCILGNCSPLRPTVISLPVQLISFGK